MVLELVDAEPIGGMVERIDGSSRPDRAVGTDCSASDEAAFVHAIVFARNQLRSELRVSAHIERSMND